MLKDPPEHVAVAEPLMTGARERRMIWDLVFDRQATKPTIGEVHLHIATQGSFRADCEHVAEHQHPDHQLRINPRASGPRVEGRQLRAYPGKVEHRGN